MLIQHSKKRILSFITILLSLWVFNLKAEMAPPQPGKPPAQNPHAPQNAAEKKRVAFAIQAVNLHLKKMPFQLLSKWPPVYRPSYQSNTKSFLNKDQNCLSQPACVKKDVAYHDELIWFHSQLGPVVETKFAHVIPWSWKNFKNNQDTKIKKSPPPADAVMDSDAPDHYAVLPHGMTPPNLKADEFMVHIYARFKDKGTQWYTLDVILSENEKGEVFLRHFYAVPMPDVGTSLPPGVDC